MCSPSTGFLPLAQLPTLAVGLNIEGHHPTKTLPPGCAWYNVIQAIDEPAKGLTFDVVMARVKEQKLSYIEEAVGISIGDWLFKQVIPLLNCIAKRHKRVLIHVHQAQGTTQLDRLIFQHTGIETILDEQDFFASPVNYALK